MTRFLNNVKTAALMAALFALVLFVGGMVGGRQGLIIAFILGGVMNFVAFFFSDRIAIAAMHGQQVDDSIAPDLMDMVRNLVQRANLPMPKVYVCPQEAPNAFATGRNPRNAAVAVTRGTLRLLDREELEGVLGHELAHIQNRDILTSTIAATIAGAISFLGYMFYFGGGRRQVGLLGALLLMILAPIAASLIQMAISRSREYVADADGARIAGSPHGLIRALQKLEGYSRQVPLQGATPAQSHMFIVKPLTAGSFSSLFSTHPRTEDRVRKLRELG